MLRAIAFDFDGVLAESVDTKTQAYASLFNNESDEAVRNIVEYHLKHGGVSRFEKFKTFYREILQRPLSEERFQELCDQFSILVSKKWWRLLGLMARKNFSKTIKTVISSSSFLEPLKTN